MPMISQQLQPPISPSVSLLTLLTSGGHHLSVPHGPTDRPTSWARGTFPLPTYLSANAIQRNSTVAEWN
ncbi:expressed protein [Echinococcus multilocularis]|uniref:Expressed protein n=1 Tax=Echinococcus multilocularis TaxID=6211 RepID=A0A068Y256_ECHMU|nr:expressed protein [Echinococcus multilocularis]